MKGLVNNAISNRIEYATHNGKGLITGNREDVTEDAIRVVFEHMMKEYSKPENKKDFFGYSFKGFGTMKYFPEQE